MRSIQRFGAVPLVLWACACASPGGSPEEDSEAPETGRLGAALTLSELGGDVTALSIVVVPAGADCDATPVARTTSQPADERTPGAHGFAGKRPFGTGWFVLRPGDYSVCVTPLAGEGPSGRCGPVRADVHVGAGGTTRVVLVSQCVGASKGAADVLVALNAPPELDDVTLDPGPYVSRCEALTIAPTASDPDDDPVSYAFAQVSGAPGSLRASADLATFFAPPGDYELAVTASDPHGASSSLSFPVHVSDATCAVPSAVEDIFVARCAPCHTSGAAGGLSLATAEAAYAGLVGQPSSATACASSARVVPGDPASSYLVAKLRAAPDICGVAMPRGRPALPEVEIATIEAWITALPR